MKPVAVIIFPGTQCDQDTAQAFSAVGLRVQLIWHTMRFNCKEYSSIVLPGGFSYGDYLRPGALAARSPAMHSVVEADRHGMPILGICNGFQILCEMGLLPGVLLKNTGLKFIDQWVELELVHPSPFWAKDKVKSPTLPIAHCEGRFFAHPHVLQDMEEKQQIWLQYKKNPNGSLKNIAGVLSKKKNTAGMMPHPERAIEDWMGSSDGFAFF